MSTKLYPTLYKRTSTGAVQTWTGEVDEANGAYRTIHGQLYGALTTTEWTQCEIKNLGKKNERSAAEQAISEMESMYKKKRRTDYFDNLDDIDTSERIKPMLALAPDKCNIEDDEVFDGQPKLDGFRCLRDRRGMFTREGLPFTTLPHILAILENAPPVPGGIIDGEAYDHALRDNFNKISSALRKGNPGGEIAEMVKKIQYWVYDLPGVDMEQSDRLILLKSWVESINSPFIIFTPTEDVPASQIEERLIRDKANGFEGTILRRKKAKYQNKRTKDLIKVKDILEEDFQLLEVEEGRGNGAGKARRAKVQDDKGIQSWVGIIGDDEYAKELFETWQQYRGQRVSVKFLNYTPDGKLRGGKMKAIRFG